MLQIAAKCALLLAINAAVTEMGLLASLSGIDYSSLNRLKEQCLKNGSIVRQADNVPIAENLFQDEAHNYLVLIGKVLREISALVGNSGPRTKAAQKQSELARINWFLWRSCSGQVMPARSWLNSLICLTEPVQSTMYKRCMTR